MKREFLETLGLDSETINKVMAENGKDIEREKSKNDLSLEKVKTLEEQVAKQSELLEKFKDYDQTKEKAEKYKQEALKATEEANAKIAELERTSQIKDYLSNKKFVNEITKNAIMQSLNDSLCSDQSKGKSLDDLFSALIGDKENILVDEKSPKPPVVTDINGGSDKKEISEMVKARSVMGLPPLKED